MELYYSHPSHYQPYWNLDAVRLLHKRTFNRERVDNKENAAIIVTALGFTYQVIGAWPLFNQAIPLAMAGRNRNLREPACIPTFYRKPISTNNRSASLYIHSKIYHQKHPKFNRCCMVWLSFLYSNIPSIRNRIIATAVMPVKK